MKPPNPRMGLRVLALASAAALLLASSISLTTVAFALRHVMATPRHLSVPFFFTGNAARQVADVPLYPNRPLRSVGLIEASVLLSLPETNANLEHSVFTVSSELHSQSQNAAASSAPASCLVRAQAHAALTFRSPAHRAIRAVAMAIPLLLGISSEYQSVNLPLLEYRVPTGAPVLDHIRISIDSSDVQVANAVLKVRIRRRAFVHTILHEHFTSYVVTAVALWYAMLIGVAIALSAMSMLRFLLRETLRYVTGVLTAGLRAPEPVTAPSQSYDPVVKESSSLCTSSVGSCTAVNRKDLRVSGRLPPRFESRSMEKSLSLRESNEPTVASSGLTSLSTDSRNLRRRKFGGA